MGMAASQARLLSITARLSNNEMEQQSLAYSKQRLSDNSEQINDAYLDALNKTKYRVLTGYNNSEACYADLTYNQLTGANTVASGKQYLVKNNEGKVLVSSAIAKAYESNNGDFNKFLVDLGYTQADIDITKHEQSEDAIHDAWDKYLSSVNKSIYDVDGQHVLGFDFVSFAKSTDDPKKKQNFNGYATYNTAYTTDSNGETIDLFKDSNGYYKERLVLEARTFVDETTNKSSIEVGYYTGNIDENGEPEFKPVDKDDEGNPLVTYNTETEKFIYKNQEGEEVEADALYVDPNETLISESYKNYMTSTDGVNYTTEGGVTYQVTKESKPLNFEGTTTAQRELYDYALALTEAYYNNSVSNTSSELKYDAEMVTYYKNIFNEMRSCGFTTTSDESNFKDNEWFVKQLKAGNLTLSYYSTAEKGFIGTTLDDDESITEKEDKSAMVIAEQVYQHQMDKIESQDKQFDLQLSKLESEHNALQTEYDSVKKVISTNVEKTFNVFNA